MCCLGVRVQDSEFRGLGAHRLFGGVGFRILSFWI